MSDRSSDSFFSTVVERYDTAVAQRQLKFALALLACYFTCHGAVYLICQPILAGYCFELQHIRQIFMEFRQFVFRHFVMTFYGFVYHICLGRRTEHLFYGKIKRTYPVSLLEGETMIAGCFANYIHWSAFAFGNLTYMLDGFFFNQ